MLETDIGKREGPDAGERLGVPGLGFFRGIEDVLKILERYFGLPVDIDDIPKLLQGPEDEERVNPQREELTERYFLGENQIEHQPENARPQEIYGRSLDEA